MNLLSRLVIATHNPNKYADLRSYITQMQEKNPDAFSKTSAVPLSDFTDEDPLETGTTFEENALIKARHSFSITNTPSLADDSGFCMHTLNGIPGIYANRFAINDQGEKDFLFAFQKLKNLLEDKDPATDFVCTLAYVDKHGEYVFRGTVPGIFDFSKSHVTGFGYTPIFVPHFNNPEKQSLAEMGDEKRRLFSARKHAFEQWQNWMTQEMAP